MKQAVIYCESVSLMWKYTWKKKKFWWRNTSTQLHA